MKRNTAQLKDKLIEIGIEEIRIKGIDQLSMRTIAQKCGVTHGAPYKHFDNKDTYMKVVLEHLSEIFLKNMTQGISSSFNARNQLVLMGCNFVRFAQQETNIFEALFIKFPFNYMEFSQTSISVNAHLPGFEYFKNIALELKKEENLSGSDVEILMHFWSFITGLAMLARSPIGDSFKETTVQETVRTMLDIYIKGAK
ncbi:TetR/AcrR family transcriptional regulator [uncultured Streptococcus sp.]|uniref:TetR/AcrR family transcriptional regulator n=1 Tax=uncultured Streptococcus sp. TaxID=83427 RepID=UPI0028DBE95E|nr:TetR/AcrR family transcriptional regulator [uncultured Streptococcus sp.]